MAHLPKAAGRPGAPAKSMNTLTTNTGPSCAHRAGSPAGKHGVVQVGRDDHRPYTRFGPTDLSGGITGFLKTTIKLDRSPTTAEETEKQ